MRRAFVFLVAMLPSAAPAVHLLAAESPTAESPTAGPPAVTLHYDAFAHGLHILAMDVALHLGPSGYQVSLQYHTIGLAGFLYPGRQSDSVNGRWVGERAAPQSYTAVGVWRGRSRRVAIDYVGGRPEVLVLLPPDTRERDPVPPALRLDSEDSLSALAQLVRQVDNRGDCRTSARTFDGRRLSVIEASTAGYETVRPDPPSIFAGTALRCDFTGHMLAGFERDRSRAAARRPLHGSAWFARVGTAPPLPVRMQFETRWFGNVTMLLTAATVTRPAVAEAAVSAR